MDRPEKTAGWHAPAGYGEVLRVAYPLVVSMGSFSVMQFCDRMFLAWYSAVSIQAALPAGILSFTMICGFMALAGYAGTFVAQYHGAEDARGCSSSTAQGAILAVASWPVMLALIPVGQFVLRASGHEAAVLGEELAYYNIIMLGAVATPLGAAIAGFFSGRGDTLTTMAANLVGNAVNIVLDYAMIFGRWGVPAMGIRGAAWATVISGFIVPAILFAIYFSPRLRAAYATWATFRPERKLLRRIVRFGLPSAFHLVLDVGSFSLFVLFTGRLGSAALAASNIALSINNIAFMPLIGMSITASILVGQYQGRGESALAEKAGWTALKIAWVYMGAVALSFVLLTQSYVGLFAGRGPGTVPLEEVLPLARFLMAMMAAWGMMDTINLVLSGALKGAGDTRFVMYYSVALAWGLWLPGEVLIVFGLGRGIVAAWVWLTVYVVIMALGFLLRYRGGRWKAIELLERETPLPPARAGAEALAVVE